MALISVRIIRSIILGSLRRAWRMPASHHHHHQVLLRGFGVKFFLSALRASFQIQEETRPSRTACSSQGQSVCVRSCGLHEITPTCCQLFWWYYCFLWLEPSWVFPCASRSIFHASLLPGNSLCIDSNRNSCRPQPRKQRRTK
jgi:hypothetical protein